MEPIAIIGIGCRFPGAQNPEAFWQLLCNGVDAIANVPKERWDVDAFYDPNPGSPGKMNTRWGGFLEQVDRFDAQFFGIAPKEASYIDPQQRLLLEVAWEALEDAAQVPQKLARTNTGVFIGISTNDYQQLLYQQHLQTGSVPSNPYIGTGNALSIAANRISYLFDFRGPSMAVDTACSSSLVAVHLGCQSLHSGDSNLVLAGGVNLLLCPELTIILSQARMMAPDGRCKTFDARANGYVRGEGCGIVVLKRLKDAQKDGDRIIALIAGSAINQDGRSNGLTAPNGPSQEAVIRQALANAGVVPSQIGYVELHGTGTPLGDPIEAEALAAVLNSDRPSNSRCAVGSVKTNIGHLEAAAGIAGLIKVALSLQHRQIPPSLHFQTPNPYIPLDKIPLQVQQILQPWPLIPTSALAGVSSFGFGGTNAHAILQMAPQLPQEQEGEKDLLSPAYLLPLSTRSPEALKSLAQAYQEFLVPPGLGTTLSLADICYTASVRRSHHDHRLALIFRNHQELTQSLTAFLQDETRAGVSYEHKQKNRHQKLVFVCSGQGSQWWAMGRELLSCEPVFRTTIEQCDALFYPLANWSLMAELTADESNSRFEETEVAQPAIFALQVALAHLWRSWGVEPSAVVGHSLGEVAAAHIAGALNLEDAVRVVFHRSRLMQQRSGQGRMAVVSLSVEKFESLLAEYVDRLSIAAINSPTSIVLSGETTVLQEAIRSLEQQQIFCKFLQVNNAFHSPQMESYQDELARSLQDINPQTASIPIISTVTGKTQPGQNFDATYWTRNIREPVYFAAAVNELVQTQHNLFVELSPHPVLGMNISQCLHACSRKGIVLPSLRRQEGEKFVMLESLGILYTQGYPIDWSRLYPSAKRCVSLPSYPWQRECYWIEQNYNHLSEQINETSKGDRYVRPVGTKNPEDFLLATKSPLCLQSNHSNSYTDRQSSTIDVVEPEAALNLNRTQLLAVKSKQQRTQLLETYMSTLFGQVTGLSTANLDLQQPLYRLGFDSLMAVELRKQIEKDLDVVIPLEIFAGLNIAQCVTQILLLVETKVSDSAVDSTNVATHLKQEVAPANLWIANLHSNPKAHLRLFCFPYAGAGASIFSAWAKELTPEIEVCPIQLPGRENRLQEAPFTGLSRLIQTLVPLLNPYLDIPFALFGHSLGALIAFELARELRRRNLPSPLVLFVSGSRAPQILDTGFLIHRFPEPLFIETLRTISGIPEKVLQNQELMQLLLPTLRADFAILETFLYVNEKPLDSPIYAFGGIQDTKVSQQELAAWSEQTHQFKLNMFPGDHFFCDSDRKLVLQVIAQEVQKFVWK
ncbi:beta-ketoacyl synthase N-terminal-like domain-containing protein [Chlorogloeopsis sp. ULAP01]|uniref:beta-ketoacyl synthase N-terminal-like domain-containing protein n=1 Tax=Chlorogloeopsis sp. ULAP01 TaxID=3056483 RepID=UPI0025AB1CD7|nr:beta-ketoacyl synthase N-terminal-like domain-containing protein [Chlorogloeopsis sp. ULAP01]MDM9383687.1 beta-ketoacyl synthase N-terminal-like domain-containing protein [Chlorogloeopsis sp. ULAP01]